jgi:hypothetical protein
MVGLATWPRSLDGSAVTISEQYPKVLGDVHCSLRALNLCAMASFRISRGASMWITLREVGMFFRFSPKRSAKLTAVIESLILQHS